jgi:hypothetical protein
MERQQLTRYNDDNNIKSTMAVLLRVCLTVCLYLLVNVAVPTQGFKITTTCAQCQNQFFQSGAPLLQKLSNRSHPLPDDSTVDQLFDATTQFLRCVQQIKCLPVNDYLLGDLINVLENLKSKKPAVLTQGFNFTTICALCQNQFLQSVMPLLQKLSDLSHSLPDDSTVDQLFDATTQFLRCAQRIKCLPVNDYLLGDVTNVLEYLKSQKSVIRRNFDCLMTLEIEPVDTRCVSGMMMTQLSAVLSPWSSSTANHSAVLCSEANYAYNCLRTITLCSSDPSVAQMLAKSFHLSVKTSLENEYNCLIDAASGASERGDVMLHMLLTLVGVATFTAFMN